MKNALAMPELTSCCAAANRAIARSEKRPRGLTHCTRWMRGTKLARKIGEAGEAKERENPPQNNNETGGKVNIHGLLSLSYPVHEIKMI